MKVKASIVTMSHLSDIQCAGQMMNEKDVNERLNFVKHIILETKGDLNQEINPDKLWNSFKGIFPDTGQTQVLSCPICHWEGMEEDLRTITDLSDDNIGHEVGYIKCCPQCEWEDLQ